MQIVNMGVWKNFIKSIKSNWQSGREGGIVHLFMSCHYVTRAGPVFFKWSVLNLSLISKNDKNVQFQKIFVSHLASWPTTTIATTTTTATTKTTTTTTLPAGCSRRLRPHPPPPLSLLATAKLVAGEFGCVIFYIF